MQTAPEKLCEFVVKRYGRQLTPKQLRGPWTYLGPNTEVTGVVIDADGDYPGFRVMLEDLQVPDFRDAPAFEDEP